MYSTVQQGNGKILLQLIWLKQKSHTRYRLSLFWANSVLLYAHME